MSNRLLNGTINGQERRKLLPERNGKARFQKDFKRSLRSCVRRKFSVEECFGTIWQETLEEIALTEKEQAEVYPELLAWAKQWRK